MPVFSERVRELKERKSVTYPQIANELGVKLRAAQGYGMGDSFPDFRRLLLLADYFDVSLDYLVGRSDDPTRR
jgi:transcriptional regulator with XRE-family HTH domain